ncbi:hypothetical protein WISP_17471 [Willisornis vidua]|uniref:ENR1 protein n=1 Tax=Willisornis vidua TaxID=1566151 RepID=A0ABQ9DV71_9PASS|nr:hypothetical protein WISP_17471 [Willisornis vidua]
MAEGERLLLRRATPDWWQRVTHGWTLAHFSPEAWADCNEFFLQNWVWAWTIKWGVIYQLVIVGGQGIPRDAPTLHLSSSPGPGEPHGLTWGQLHLWVGDLGEFRAGD